MHVLSKLVGPLLTLHKITPRSILEKKRFRSAKQTSSVALRQGNMDIQKHIKAGILKVIVKPNAPKTEIISWDDNKQALRIAVSAVPDKNKANNNLLKFLKKQTGKKCEIVSGTKSREKVIRFY